jgi:hypothetical protein
MSRHVLRTIPSTSLRLQTKPSNFFKNHPKMVGTNNANHQPSLIHGSSGENSSNPDADIVIVTTSRVMEATNASPKTNPVKDVLNLQSDEGIL